MRLLPFVFAATLVASAAAASEVSQERCVADSAAAIVDGGGESLPTGTIVREADDAASLAPGEVAGVPADESLSRAFTDLGGADGRPKGISPIDPPEPCDDG